MKKRTTSIQSQQTPTSTDSVELTKYIFREANLPEPIETVSKINKRVSWGEDNLQPQFLNRMYYENPVHGGIVNQKVKFITAGGLSVEGGDASVLDNNGSAYSLQEVVDSVCRDFEIGETQCWYFKKNIGTGVWSVEPMDYELIRVNESDTFYDYSEDWSKKQQGAAQNYRQIRNIHFVQEDDTECLMRVVTRPKQRNFEGRTELTANYYPAVNYSGAITDILTGIEMSFFTYSEVVNGWKGGTLINLANGRPKDANERRKIESELKINATDRNKQGGIVLTYSDGKERAPEVHQISGNDLDKRYEQAKRTSRDNIMVAHGVISPALFGVFTESMFGSKEEMEIAYILFKENYVNVRQRQIADPLNWALAKLNKFTGKIVFNDYFPSILKPFEVVAPVEDIQFSEVDNSMDIISEFAKVGVSRNECNIVFSKSYESYEDNEEEFKAEYSRSKFATELTENQKVIITMVLNGESYGAIKTALKITGYELSNELRTLGNLGLLDGWEVTAKGSELTLPKSELQVFYSYEKKPTAPDLVKGGKSRPFCEILVRLDRLYTRQEIDQIGASAGIDRDVWRYRGGWYHNPITGVNTPSCRHTWVQNIVIK